MACHVDCKIIETICIYAAPHPMRLHIDCYRFIEFCQNLLLIFVLAVSQNIVARNKISYNDFRATGARALCLHAGHPIACQMDSPGDGLPEIFGRMIEGHTPRVCQCPLRVKGPKWLFAM